MLPFRLGALTGLAGAALTGGAVAVCLGAELVAFFAALFL